MNFRKIKADLSYVYDDLAKYWGKDIAKPDWGLDEEERFVFLVKKNGEKKVLDLGCGSGVQSKQLSQKGLEVVGFDLSLEMIKEAKKKVPKAKFVVGDMTKMSFPEGSFGGVFAQASLLHIPKKLIPKVLEKIHKILKKDGILYLALKEGFGEREVVEERFGKEIKRFFSFFTQKEISELLKNNQFRVIEAKRNLRKPQTVWLHVFAVKD